MPTVYNTAMNYAYNLISPGLGPQSKYVTRNITAVFLDNGSAVLRVEDCAYHMINTCKTHHSESQQCPSTVLRLSKSMPVLSFSPL
jgi:hypothetical protein